MVNETSVDDIINYVTQDFINKNIFVDNLPGKEFYKNSRLREDNKWYASRKLARELGSAKPKVEALLDLYYKNRFCLQFVKNRNNIVIQSIPTKNSQMVDYIFSLYLMIMEPHLTIKLLRYVDVDTYPFIDIPLDLEIEYCHVPEEFALTKKLTINIAEDDKTKKFVFKL